MSTDSIEDAQSIKELLENTSVRCDMACDVLRATNDGDDLHPKHLKLVEIIVNGDANECGRATFIRLCGLCARSEYSPDADLEAA